MRFLSTAATVLVFAASACMAAPSAPFPPPAKVLLDDTPTQCTSLTAATSSTIDRAGEGIWHINKADQTGPQQLHVVRQVDWLDNNKTAVLDDCTSICLAGNSTEVPGQWLPSGRYAEGMFINTPGGSGQHPLWSCGCYDRTLSQDDLAAGGGVDNGANPGSGTIVNRVC